MVNDDEVPERPLAGTGTWGVHVYSFEPVMDNTHSWDTKASEPRDIGGFRVVVKP